MAIPTDVDGTWGDSGGALDGGELRRADSGIFAGIGDPIGIGGGVARHGDTSLGVTVDGADVVTVQAGSWVAPGNAVSGSGCWRYGLSAAITGSLAARNATNPRITLVVARALDTSVVGAHAAYKGRIEFINGTAAASPTVPSLPTMAVELARITVPNTGGGAASVDLSHRTYVTAIGARLAVPTFSMLPTAAAKGQLAVALDTLAEYEWDGTATWAPKNVEAVAWKTADENVSSSTTLQNDDHLSVSLAANARYFLDGYIAYSGIITASGPGDMKADWTIPASATMRWTTGSPGLNSPNGINLLETTHSTVQTLGTYGTGFTLTAHPSGWITTGGTSGTLQFRWAQNTSNATATSVKAGSWIRVRRVA